MKFIPFPRFDKYSSLSVQNSVEYWNEDTTHDVKHVSTLKTPPNDAKPYYGSTVVLFMISKWKYAFPISSNWSFRFIPALHLYYSP